MLLPRDPTELGELGNAEDPRRELVERLLEHERFKAAAQMLMPEAADRRGHLDQARPQATSSKIRASSRPTKTARSPPTPSTSSASSRTSSQRLRDRPVLNIDEDSVTVAPDDRLRQTPPHHGGQARQPAPLLQNTRSERALICTFLAMLELVRLQAILLRQAESLGDILIKKSRPLRPGHGRRSLRPRRLELAPN